mmetsp:Transcript_118905/g.296654  ORF Transcript_118905/g.296654 Transcript_118905/m.296654 type:complete len:110 (+) Transcript_118905:1139-1468(+)
MVLVDGIAMAVRQAKVDIELEDENVFGTRAGAAATRAAGGGAGVKEPGRPVLMVLAQSNMAAATTEPTSTCSSAKMSLRLVLQALCDPCQNLTRKRSWGLMAVRIATSS